MAKATGFQRGTWCSAISTRQKLSQTTDATATASALEIAARGDALRKFFRVAGAIDRSNLSINRADLKYYDLRQRLSIPSARVIQGDFQLSSCSHVSRLHETHGAKLVGLEKRIWELSVAPNT